MREYFCAYHSMLGAMRKLSDAECGRLFRALLMYSSGEQPDNLQGREDLLFDVFSQQIDRDSEKYKSKCETNRANRKGPNTDDNDRQRPSTTVIVRDQEKEKDKDKEESSSAGAGFLADDDAAAIMDGHNQVFDRAKGCGFDLNAHTMDALTDLIGKHGVERMLTALDDCAEHGAKSLAYLRKVLEGKPKAAADDGEWLQRLF